MTQKELKEFLDEKFELYNTLDFIPDDPIQIPHKFSQPEDIEIAGLFAAQFAWGKREQTIKCTKDLMNRMENMPHDFVLNHEKSDLTPFNNWVHRTFNSDDLAVYLSGLKEIYKAHGSLGAYFKKSFDQRENQAQVISWFKQDMLKFATTNKSNKHLPDPLKKSAAKRICMLKKVI